MSKLPGVRCLFLLFVVGCAVFRVSHAQSLGFWEHPFSDTLNDAVRDVALNAAGDLYIVGDFTEAGGQTLNHVARWGGSRWESLGNGLNNPAYAIAIIDRYVYVGGRFSRADTIETANIARWDGERWETVGPGLNNWVFDLVTHQGDLYAGGRFTQLEGDNQGASYGGVARWDGQDWHPLNAGFDRVGVDGQGIDVLALATDGEYVYAGGSFIESEGQPTSGLARWDGNDWLSIGGGIPGTVRSITFDQGGRLYAGGNFEPVSEFPASNVAMWDGVHWSALGGGLGNQVNALAHVAGRLFAGGSLLLQTDDGAFQSVSEWSGLEWLTLGMGIDSNVFGLVGDGDRLYIGGTFDEVNERLSSRIAVWNAGLPTNNERMAGYHENISLSLHPNPFAESVTITITIDLPSYLRVSIYDILGRKIEDVIDRDVVSGIHTYAWDGTSVQAGMYMVRIVSNGSSYSYPITKLN